MFRDLSTPLAFIVGVPRSGTTLLSAILNRHPLVCVTPETHFYRYLHSTEGGWSAVAADWPAGGVRFLGKMFNAPLFGLDPDDLTTNWVDQPPSSAEFLCAIGSHYASRHGKSRWVEKTPDHVSYLRQLRTDFPEVPVIHMVRDGRDVALSLSQTGWEWQSPYYLSNLAQWVQQVGRGREALAEDRFALAVRYEDLLSSPEATVARVCCFLGLDFVPHILRPDGSEGSLIESGTTVKEAVRRPIMKENRAKWRTALGPELCLISDLSAGPELARWGYEVGVKPAAGDHWYLGRGVASEAEAFYHSAGQVVARRQPRVTILRRPLAAVDLNGCDVLVLSNRFLSDIRADRKGMRRRLSSWRGGLSRLWRFMQTGRTVLALACPLRPSAVALSLAFRLSGGKAGRLVLILCEDERAREPRWVFRLLRRWVTMVRGRLSAHQSPRVHSSKLPPLASEAAREGNHAEH
jgi:hypothetical protein